MLISTNLIPWDLGGSFEKTAMRVGSINCQKKRLSGDYESCCQVKHTPHTKPTLFMKCMATLLWVHKTLAV